ncbi:MAG: hypothetical protein ABIR59_08410 [Gemmatimonadales bacterium]
MTFWRKTIMALAVVTTPAAAAVAQGGVSVGGFETEGSIGLSRDEYDALGRALTALLTAEVRGTAGVQVIAIPSVAGKPGAVDLSAVRASAKAAGAKVLVVGSLLDQYGDIHVEARMINAATGEPIAVVRGDPTLVKREQLAQAIADLADRLAQQQGSAGRNGASRAAVPVDALVSFGKGLRYEDAGDRAKAAESYRAAVRAAPGFSEAAAALQRVGS